NVCLKHCDFPAQCKQISLASIFLKLNQDVVHSSCPAGLDLVSDGQCRGNYTRINSRYDDTANDAIVKCKEIRSQPIIIHNEEQQSYWAGRASKEGIVTGLVCNTKSKQWEWTDSSPIDYKPPRGLYDSGLDKSCQTGWSWLIRSDGQWAVGSGRRSWTSDIYCISHLPPPPLPSENCESFEDDSEDAVCYQIGATAFNWRDAQKICGSFGADLASIHNDRENTFIRRLALSKGQLNGLYLGALMSGNEFSWIDGSEWSYQNFYPGFPIDGLGNCVIMDSQGVTGQWVNVDCNSQASVACTRPQNSYSSLFCPSESPKEGQIIFSPGFPFDASTPCDFMLIVDEGKRVEVEILILEANSCCDRLVLFENYYGGDIIANLTGAMKEQVYTTSSSNFMKVSWQPKGGANVRGMMMTFRGV
ncbi:hypothetical protein PENTCL1PPCAC_21940, partial [Pristionchus entomophagus]